jgi:hypothetical protein
MNHMSNIHKYVEFKLIVDENNNINYLDLTIHRPNNNLSLGIYRKSTQTDVTKHFTSNHPLEQKLAAFIFYITPPITERAKRREWNTILTLTKNIGFPLHIIHNLRNKLITTNIVHTSTPKEKMDHIHLSQSTYTQNN